MANQRIDNKTNSLAAKLNDNNVTMSFAAISTIPAFGASQFLQIEQQDRFIADDDSQLAINHVSAAKGLSGKSRSRSQWQCEWVTRNTDHQGW